ncbi:hypothetical protein [Rudaea sp.]|uniref:hypothetical protein n=1 Tax=Rudaea sp. TaxID=2136325 RepID=UPI0037840DB4
MSRRETLRHNSKIILGDRLTVRQFLFSEAILFTTQIVIFCLVAVIMSGFLTQEGTLADFVNAKINKNFMMEFLVTLVLLITVLGVFSMVQRGAGKIWASDIQRIADEVTYEAPRIVYASGSSITGATLAVGFFLIKHPEAQVPNVGWWFGMAAFFAVVFFIMGAGLAYWLKRESHLIQEGTE